jgi:hypothetical protein
LLEPLAIEIITLESGHAFLGSPSILPVKYWSILAEHCGPQLGVQVVEACLITRAANGGLIDMDDLLRRVMSRRARGSQTPSLDDLERAVKKLHVLGNGFDIIQVCSVCRYPMSEEIPPEFVQPGALDARVP